MDIRTAIQTGDAVALHRLLVEDPARANQLVEWGKNCEIHTHPLHFVSDMLFAGTLPRGKETPLVEALLETGANYNHQAPNGETPLIGAASLGAEDVGLRLLDAGADPRARGGFKETALHWAAMLGLDRLVAALIAKGSDVSLKDAKYNSTPLGWAMHGRSNPSGPGAKGRFDEVIAMLTAAGAASPAGV
jgi:ankyrin repeat protein